MRKHILLGIAILLILATVSLPLQVAEASSGTTVMKNSVSLSRPGGSSSPDLTVTSISFSPESPASGVTVTITATIKNIGDTTAWKFYVGFYLDVISSENLIGTIRIVLLKTGASKDVSVDWTAIEGTHEITVFADSTNVVAESNEDNNVASKTITVGPAAPPPPPAIEYELFIEIDYIVIATHNATPTLEVLSYIHDYYYERGINVTFILNDIIDEAALSSLGVDPSNGINDDEFWAIEKAYNDVFYYDDQAKDGVDTDGDGYDMEFKLKEKWLLFGNIVEGKPNVVGYCWVLVKGLIILDFIAGNYMFVADQTGDNWASSNGIELYGAEAVVVMHEMGHSIGIGKANRFTGEIYCNNPECVMAKLSTANADNYWAWFYCDDHWAQKNLEYYVI